jgi:hypothetical protein
LAERTREHVAPQHEEGDFSRFPPDPRQ